MEVWVLFGKWSLVAWSCYRADLNSTELDKEKDIGGEGSSFKVRWKGAEDGKGVNTRIWVGGEHVQKALSKILKN